jgi:4-hydroxybenzoyl-CoA thioesterase
MESTTGGKTSVYRVDVHFGDCDPAGIVFFPNFSRWMDAASHAFFWHCGLPPWHSMPELPNSVGAPMLEIHTRFVTAATYGERLDIHTRIEEWRNKVFVQHHRIVRGEDLICEGRETRALCVRDPASGRIKAIPIPAFIRERCS